ncbi:MAG: CPBP family intramembrane metalloprotease [Ferrovibrio sp.]|uniref:CPBP family intramembrane glutamic endopeptidase n=1 Tax=Ferrovibrio sp. TaxID=1917215 RepID=UPI002629BF8F|nr:CPBP family intramembrane glutamic endopeptidase [Ferrovibrio sp.]MCW0235557.1 CPBP family intramembrane metalloprotease [Ferrovibrio sp.]
MSTISDETVPPAAMPERISDAGVAAVDAAAGRMRKTGLRLLVQAILWCLGAVFFAGIIGFAAGFSLSVTGIKLGLTPGDLNTIYYICGLVGAGGTLLYAARRNGRIAGGGDLRRGLGDGPMRRVWPVVLLAVGVAIYGSLVSYAVFRQPAMLRGVAETGWLLNILLVALAILLAPLAEELFFRGWLWTALRQHWAAPLVALATSLLWLGLHLPDGVGRTLALIPVAVCIALARHFAGTVGAALAVHIVYNIFSVGMPFLLLAAR